MLVGLQAEHDFTKSFPEYKHRGSEEEHQRWRLAVQKNPPLLHPVIRTHPVTGKQALFVNEGFTTRIVELAAKESDALLNFLFAHITKPEFQVRWRWQANDIAIWDNRVTQHYANADYLPQRRIMHRATILGISRSIAPEDHSTIRFLEKFLISTPAFLRYRRALRAPVATLAGFLKHLRSVKTPHQALRCTVCDKIISITSCNWESVNSAGRQ